MCARIGLWLLAVLLLGSAASAERRVALVIGNSNYSFAQRLSNPPNDAAAMSVLLESAGFQVVETRNDLGNMEMRRVIRDFAEMTRDADMAVVFYAGHGMEVGGENWLIPISAELRSDADIESEAVSLRSISLQVSKARQLGLDDAFPPSC